MRMAGSCERPFRAVRRDAKHRLGSRNSTLTALMPYRQGLLPSVPPFVEHLAADFPKAVHV